MKLNTDAVYGIAVWRSRDQVNDRIKLGLRPADEMIGAPGGIRTPNPQIRSLMLCPVELRALPGC